MLTSFLPVVRLQVVDDRQVIDVAAVLRDVPVLISRVFSFKLLDQLVYAHEIIV